MEEFRRQQQRGRRLAAAIVVGVLVVTALVVFVIGPRWFDGPADPIDPIEDQFNALVGIRAG